MSKNTKYLFFLSIFLAFYSFFAMKNGGREFYPFYSWKLFSVPSGNHKLEKEFRLYGIKNGDTIRINITFSKLFDENEKYSLINSYGDLISRNTDSRKNKKELLDFAKLIEPGYNDYLLVKESYHPLDLFKKPQIFHREKIIALE